MRNLYSILFLLATVSVFSMDKIVLSNGTILEGSIVKMSKKNFFIQIDDKIEKISNLDVGLVSFQEEISDMEKYRLGELDGQRYAKNKGGNIAIGFLVSIVGTGIVYLTSDQSPSVESMLGPNKAIVNDPNYIDGYSKGARSKSTSNAAIGTIAWLLLLLL